MSHLSKTAFLSGAVGARAPNLAHDVGKVQYLFTVIAPPEAKPTPESGTCSADLIATIRHFQRSFSGVPHPDGRIDPHGPTMRHLLEKALSLRRGRKDLGPFPPTGKLSLRGQVDQYLYLATMPFAQRTASHAAAMSGGGSKAGTLTDKDFAEAATALDPKVPSALLHAFARTESGGKSGMDSKGRPIIAYEGHVFRRYTACKAGKPPVTTHPYDATYPLLSYPYKKKAGPEWQKNNKDPDASWATLDAALALDHDAALKACSWGMFQVMGFNFEACGYDTVDAFVAEMKASERGQLNAFVGFCKSTPGMVTAMIAKNFVNMASLYNGSDYGDYDKLIAKFYKEYGGV
jgi:hypothetical protein